MPNDTTSAVVNGHLTTWTYKSKIPASCFVRNRPMVCEIWGTQYGDCVDDRLVV